MSKTKKIVLSAVVLAVIISSVNIFMYIKSVKDYQNEIKTMVFTDIDISSIPDGSYIGDCNVDFIYAKVEVVVRDGRITEINLLEHKNDRGKPAEVITQTMVEKQTVNVDAVSSATNSSNVIKKAVENTLLTSKSE